MTETPKVMSERFGNVRKILQGWEQDMVRWEFNAEGEIPKALILLCVEE